MTSVCCTCISYIPSFHFYQSSVSAHVSIPSSFCKYCYEHLRPVLYTTRDVSDVTQFKGHMKTSTYTHLNLSRIKFPCVLCLSLWEKDLFVACQNVAPRQRVRNKTLRDINDS